MSEAAVGAETEASDDAPTNAELAQQVSALRKEVRARDERIAELEEKVEQQASLIWESGQIEDLKLVHPEMGFEYSLGATISNKLSPDDIESEYGTSLEQLVDDVEGLKQGEIDTSDLVGGVEPELPIEEDLAKANNDTRRTELSTNELRAVYVFRNYISESKPWSGFLKLDSADVRRILENEGESNLNDNDPRRTMRMLAKKSADVPKDERDPEHEDNLFTLTKGDKRLELHADKDELVEFWQGMEERYRP